MLEEGVKKKKGKKWEKNALKTRERGRERRNCFKLQYKQNQKPKKD